MAARRCRLHDDAHRAEEETGAIDQARVLNGLRDPAAFGPQCRSVEVIETHISYVFLTGEYAYKVKKAIRLPFLDFATLESRHGYCELEVALNRRTAPALYVDVIPIVERAGRFVAGGAGGAVEWAVRVVFAVPID